MLETLRAALPGSIILLHACAHNPTGVDPTQEQWKEIAAVIRERQHFPFFDTAYQGFASGDLVRDAWAIRYFAEQGFEFCVAQSFAKNLGLYGQRTGAFHFISAPGTNAAMANQNIATQLAVLQRSEISNPAAYGARIASRILNDPQLFAEWEQDLRTMSGRIQEMRKGLRARLEAKGTPGTWNHVTDQIGMFSFTGLTETQVKILREKWHIYMVSFPYSSSYNTICIGVGALGFPSADLTVPRPLTASAMRQDGRCACSAVGNGAGFRPPEPINIHRPITVQDNG